MINYRGLSIPFTRLGTNVTSDNLFDPNEQVIFDFYAANKTRYRRAVDIGANIGVHSILMAQQGWEVRAYEPDPIHYQQLGRNVEAHRVVVWGRNAAVSDRDGWVRFIRVLDNTTASHIEGARESYGRQEEISVELVDCRPLFEWADFAKIDCEGHEAVLVGTTTAETWDHLDAMLEVGSRENARMIYEHLLNVVPMWAQKIGWGQVRSFEDMPVRHQDGSLFVGKQFVMGG
jgi:FkbM family methyltransferase